MIDFLLGAGANPNIRNYEGENCVFLAVRWCGVDVLERILDAGGDPNLYNKAAASPLHLCVDFLASDAAQVILAKGANPDYQNSEGQTPLHLACARRELNLAQLLYDKGANPEVRDAQLRNVWGCCDAEFKAVVTREAPPPEPPAPEGPPKPVDPMQWLIDGKCFVCQTEAADRGLLPCRHKVLCHNCASGFLEHYNSCPQCYMAIYGTVPLS